ncbi:hypothetical protein [Tepidimicrobium xylanilyticum]|uniref:hypothetical protein n=1 Tax=Tepidimicrobium xylanilyticum TaxID=1123352 RepID=UPI0026569160|nr:hypothetical protein [Tepidimicrobium xylanilyticum]GMG97768.1 hypothetical protein EN5CB1_25940 [Tepidimicrobium xylanilyticum]
MGRKPKYSKKVKIKACKDYEKGHINFQGIANDIRTTKEVVRRKNFNFKKRGIRKKTSLLKVRQEAEYKTVDFFKDKGYSVTKICKVLNTSRSGYYKHKNRVKPEKEKQDELLCSLITEYHSTFDEILMYRKMTMFINKLNHKSFSERYIHRLMNVLGITARIIRKKLIALE